MCNYEVKKNLSATDFLYIFFYLPTKEQETLINLRKTTDTCINVKCTHSPCGKRRNRLLSHITAAARGSTVIYLKMLKYNEIKQVAK